LIPPSCLISLSETLIGEAKVESPKINKKTMDNKYLLCFNLSLN